MRVRLHWLSCVVVVFCVLTTRQLLSITNTLLSMDEMSVSHTCPTDIKAIPGTVNNESKVEHECSVLLSMMYTASTLVLNKAEM